MNSYEILEKHLDSNNVRPEEREELISHIHRVVVICEAFVDELTPTDINNEALMNAAILHDICKYDDDNKHEKVGADLVEKEYSADIKDVKIVGDIIRAHRKKFKPSDTVWLEAAILRMADKLDKYAKGKANVENKCKKSIEAIEEYVSDHGISDKQFDMFMNAYEKIQKDCKAKQRPL